MHKIGLWREFIATGFTESDLTITVALLRFKIKRGHKTLSCLRFGNFIGNLEWFSEDLAEAKALARAPKPPAHNRTLHQTGHTAKVHSETTRPIGDVIRGQEALAQLLRLRDSL